MLVTVLWISRATSVHLGRAEAALGEPGRAQADAHRQRGQRVAGDGVLVGDDAGQVQDADGRLAAQRRMPRLSSASTLFRSSMQKCVSVPP